MEKLVYQSISQMVEDPILDRHTCAVSGEEFPRFASDETFYTKVTASFAGKSFPFPFPTMCPEERQKRRLVRRGKEFYLRDCDKTGKKSFSIWPPEAEMTTYSHEAFNADIWNGLERGKDIDFTRPFFDQFNELWCQTPKNIANAFANENSQFVIHCHKNKNCYMTDETDFSQYCYYGYNLQTCVYCVDSLYLRECQRCYEVIQGEHCYQVFYATDVYNCSDCAFVTNCYGCKNCLFCNDLHNASYHIFNKAVSKEEFETIWNYIFTGEKKSIDDAKTKLEIFLNEQAHQARKEKNCELSVGNNIVNCKSCVLCTSIDNSQHCKYCLDIHNSNRCQDVDIYHGELLYNGVHLGPEGYKNICSHMCRYCSDIRYSSAMYSCKHCFGCSGLKNQEYCIFNKKYNKETYEELVAQLIQHMIGGGERGSFFPVHYSPYAYNETMAMLHYPLTEEEAKEQGFSRAPERDLHTTLPVVALGSLNTYVSDEKRKHLLSGVIQCKKTHKYFKITSQELTFYEMFKLPLPRLHPSQRENERRAKRSYQTLFVRPCAETGKDIVSIYPGDDERKVYSDEGYKKLFG